MKYLSKIGFMQGRLSDLVSNKIQAFPKKDWEKEFAEAHSIDLQLMEWTIDYEGLYQNPLMKSLGRSKIKKLSQEFKLQIPSITADCFMQKPFWKSCGNEMISLKKIFIDVLHASSELGISMIIVPLVDNGSLENAYQEDKLIKFLEECFSNIKTLGINILFESDFEPSRLKIFMDSRGKFNFTSELGSKFLSATPMIEELLISIPIWTWSPNQ